MRLPRETSLHRPSSSSPCTAQVRQPAPAYADNNMHALSMLSMTSLACKAMVCPRRVSLRTHIWRAGTPLGDPIEVGALGQALSGRQAPGVIPDATPDNSCVSLASVKACFGHTEGAAGLTGALLALETLNTASAPGVMHLRTPNTYVEAALADWQKRHARLAHVPRQLAPGQQHSGGLAGSSSFGMSGVNAHVLLAADACPSQVATWLSTSHLYFHTGYALVQVLAYMPMKGSSGIATSSVP